MDPQPRTLRLTLPYLNGPDVAAVHRMLGVEDYGVLGPVTAAAVAAWKRARGYRTASNELTPADRHRLLADVPLRAVRTMERWAA